MLLPGTKRQRGEGNKDLVSLDDDFKEDNDDISDSDSDEVSPFSGPK